MRYGEERMTNDKSGSQQINTTLYPNRWIAVVRGRVVGVGLTQGQAYRAAMHTRSKDKPQLYFVDEVGQITTTEAQDGV